MSEISLLSQTISQLFLNKHMINGMVQTNLFIYNKKLHQINNFYGVLTNSQVVMATKITH